MANRVHPCRRCGGMMVETYADRLSPSERGGEVFVWRCVNCGDYVDRQVLQNRSTQGEGIHAPLTVIQHNILPLRARPIIAHRRMEAA